MASKMSTKIIIAYKTKNINVVSRKPKSGSSTVLRESTKHPAIVGPIKLPKENADNQTHRN